MVPHPWMPGWGQLVSPAQTLLPTRHPLPFPVLPAPALCPCLMPLGVD